MTYMIRGGDGSHWEGCEDTHWDCKIRKLEAEVERLKEEGRWILVSEKQPEKADWYPVWYRLAGYWYLQEDAYYIGNGIWQEVENCGKIYCWHYPLPEPPEVS